MPVRPRRAVVTVGVFDGVHRAHQQLIRAAVAQARALRGDSVAITFDPDPQHVLAPSSAEPALMPLEERLEQLKALSLDLIWVIPFTKRFASTTAEDFVHRVLIGRLQAAALVVGEAFLFGRDREGDMAMLRALGPAHGMRIVPVQQVMWRGQPISSSRIRRLIREGRLAQAKQLLGRPPALYGVVVRGVGRGRRLGFPTANIRLIPQALPPQGVYAVTVRARGSHREWPGVMNLGVRPTFGPGPLVCEAHMLGFAGTLIGRAMTVSLLARLRNERRFPSPQALARQIRRDRSRATRLLRSIPSAARKVSNR